MLNSLSQTLVKFTSPGVPDLYQGNEVWNLSLVDPDNRRPVDYGRLRELLQEMKQKVAADGMATLMRENALFAVPAEGRAKLFLTWRALHARREQADLFENGDYVPLAAGGARSEHVVAYARRWQDEGLIVIAGRLFARLAPEPGDLPLGEGAWGDTSVDASVIPADAQLQDVFTGRNVAVAGGRLWMRDAFADFPAVLLRYRAAVN